MQLLDLIDEKNGVVFLFEEFFVMVERDFNRSIFLDIRALTEDRKDTHNLLTFANEVEQYSRKLDDSKRISLVPLIDELKDHKKASIVRPATKVASTRAAHLSLKQSKEEELFTYDSLREWLTSVGKTLNSISGIIWDSSVVLQLSESENDRFKTEMRYIDKARLSGSRLITMGDPHEAIDYADSIIKMRK